MGFPFHSPLLPILFALLSATSASLAAVDEPLQLNDDVLGLVVFKSGVHDRSSRLAGWSEDDASPCAWSFVRCSPGNGRVDRIFLGGLGLSGKIGRGLEKLQFLKVLSLSGNNFSGGIPPGLGLLPRLRMLNLSRNSISGTIPSSLSNLISIRFVDLSRNLLTGTLSDELLENWSSIRFLSLAENDLEGPAPSALSKCTLLNHLNLSNNRFSGDLRFSGGIRGLGRLRFLDVSNNEFSGSLPSDLPFLHNLKELSARGNRFSGEFPIQLGLNPHLLRLDLSRNFFTGKLSDAASLQRLKSLTFLNLSHNRLYGAFPPWIGNMSSLEFLDLSGNALDGPIPDSLGGLKSLRHLTLNDNRLEGEIPKSLASCTALAVLRLRGNLLSGTIPEELFGIGIEVVDFSRNGLSGPVPSGSGMIFETLRVMDLSMNNLTGNIPKEMGLFSRLGYLNLSWNQFHSGFIPEVEYSPRLVSLDLRNCALMGSIPRSVCVSGSLRILQLDGNSLSGSIPDEFGNCSSLFLLSLSHNNLSGSIPKSFSMLSRLKILKLEFNQLSGEIPPQLSHLENLLAVNVSHNRLVGRIPPGRVFQNLDQSAIEGNLGICSPLLRGPCRMNAAKPIVIDPFGYRNHTDDGDGDGDVGPLRSSRHNTFLSVSAIVAISAAGIIVLGVMVITILNASVKRRLSLAENGGLERTCSGSSRSRRSVDAGRLILLDAKPSRDWLNASTFESVLNKALEVGEGVFGTVYKAPVGGDCGGTAVAIKKLVASKVLQHPEDFDREVRALGKARHPNLVPLRGYYWTPHLQLLVSDFVPGGNLESMLHETGAPPLTWPARFEIILGTAKGLAHLHHSCQPPIVHYNVNPSNVLLDENLDPRISDFGLAGLVNVHVMSDQLQAASGAGYVAPELASHSTRVNEKCDVYGFGMLALELVTGRRPVEHGEGDAVLIMNDHVRALLEQGNVLDCVDPVMGAYPDDEVLPVLKLALVCTSQVPSSRPSMAQVVQILQVIMTQLPSRT
ncbi:hypothetical protein DM860_001514 [Cuscuta australis]|uniref:Protein kinase domain-containing protein n=1 Tax=Cuscuta australis TaxID=267555 RepID=A0A328EAK3_9ASTE|nr:hypothetical protein DM860_001514 [Cuscuta australis]